MADAAGVGIRHLNPYPARPYTAAAVLNLLYDVK